MASKKVFNHLWKFLFLVVSAEANSSKCPWKPRGEIIYGSRQGTEAGSSVAISDDGSVLAIEEYGDSNGPYKQNGHGTGRLRILEWNSDSKAYEDAQVFTEGLSTGMFLSADGSIVSTIGFNIENDSETSEIDWLVQIYERNENNEWKPRGPTFRKGGGHAGALPFYPTDHYLSRNGNTLAISGGQEGPSSEDIGSWKSVHRVYDYLGGSEWKQLGSDVVLDGAITAITLTASGRSFGVITWQANDDLSDPRVTAHVYDYEGTNDTWVQRGVAITMPVVDARIPTFDVHLSQDDDASIMVIQAVERTSATTTIRSTSSQVHNEDSAGLLFVYEYKKDSDEWTLRAPKTTVDEAQGYRTVVSADVNTIVVSGIDNPDGWRDAVGFLKVFVFNPELSKYQLQQDMMPVPGGDGLAMTNSGRFIASSMIWADDSTGAVQVYELREGHDDGNTTCPPYDFIPQRNQTDLESITPTDGPSVADEESSATMLSRDSFWIPGSLLGMIGVFTAIFG